MNSNTFRLAALAAAAAPVALFAAFPAQAAAPATTGTGEGKASAVVLRTALDVSLVGKTVDVPLTATLNEVHAPQSAEKTALSVRLDGVDKGPVQVLRADVATSGATADERRAEGHSNLVKARVQVPGLPLLPLIEVEKVTSKAVCEVGRKPVAESNVLGHVTVLGKRITLTAGGRTEVDVPGVGKVTLDLSKTSTTSKTAAAAALQLRISLNPGNLNVADVKGDITLAEATCSTPGSGHGGSGNGGSGHGGSGHGGSGHGGSGNGGTDDGGYGDDGGSDDGGTDDGGATDSGATGDNGSGETSGDTGDSGSTDGGQEDGGATDEGATGDTGSTGSTSGGGDVKTQTGADNSPATVSGDDLAETGSSSSTPLIAGGAALLLALGAGATVLARRRAQD
ncbi:SCO1860 family LAETG-anchored protein [Streptomyces sp. NBC_00102]|uniref:SCO1860 family LAETG-anchored protein n=1 Tax=Streptomyces sp. NBC_00102 TaxID=2975652 RepID=UPI002250F51C|nr:SCO1860 family LAETG-anchored protein [Streptomyces sp. NBC_00102]MCX5396250.1 LPXTG cell wall anchor domain-containing protein [Streptomyces sp. NBC_00102]